MIGWFKSRSLKDALKDTKKIKISGVLFEIKKIDILSHLDGSKVMLKLFDTYRLDPSKQVDDASMKKIKSHYTDVIMAGVIKPKLSRKNDSELVCVDEIFQNWPLAQELYEQIMSLTYGKKKLQEAYRG
jgi:hypothetical protein